MNRVVRSLSLVTLSVLAASFASAPVSAQDPSPHDPARLFPREASVDTGGASGLVRLPLTSEVLSTTRPDLSDLRLHDATSRDIAFLVDSGARARPATMRYLVEPTEIERRIEEAESLAPHWIETLVVAAPGDASRDGRWVIAVDSDLPAFVRSVVVSTIEGDARTEIARGTIFRMQDPVRERLTVELPPLVTPTGDAMTPPRFEIAIVGEGGYLEPTLRFVVSRVPLAPPTLTLPLEELGRTVQEGRTIVELVRPVGLSPDRLRISTSTGTFVRAVTVSDVRQGYRASQVGAAQLFRVREIEGAEMIEVDVGGTQGEHLRVEIVDGDSPALEALRFEAVIRQPILVFEAPPGEVFLRFGGGRAHRPVYDMQRLAGSGLGDLVLGAERPEATLSPIRDNPRFDDGPALRFAMRPGRVVSLATFSHVTPVTIEGAREGLSRLRLPAAVLATAREDLRDVRVVDDQDRQWPYVLSPAEERDVVAGSADPPRVESSESLYIIRPPVERAVVDLLVLHTDAPYIARPYVLRGIDDDGRRRELARGELSRAPDESLPIEIAVARTRVSQLELTVEDGSDAPLSLTSVQLGVPSRSLFLAAPDGTYRLLTGDLDQSPPDYEIARATDLVLAVRSAAGVVGAPSANSAHVVPAWYEAGDWQTWLLWAVLVLAVLILGFLTMRIARQDPPAGSGGPGGEAPPPGGGSAEPPGASGGPERRASGEGGSSEAGSSEAGRDADDEGRATKPTSF